MLNGQSACAVEAETGVSEAASSPGDFPKDGIDLGGRKRADVSGFRGQVYVSVREWYEVTCPTTMTDLSMNTSNQPAVALSNTRPVNTCFKMRCVHACCNASPETYSARTTCQGAACAVQKDGKLMPGQKGISLHGTDQFSKVVEHVAEISAALSAEDEQYELPLSDK